VHIIIGFLTGLVTIFYLLDRLGVDLGGFNPFDWRRRRAWSKKFNSDPINSVEDPMHIAALLILGAAKLDGVISAEQKGVALEQFEITFSLDARDASELVGSAMHLLGAPQIIDAQLQGLADKNKNCFKQEQVGSMLNLMKIVAAADGELDAAQTEYIEKMRTHFVPPEQDHGTWS
jgi:hypothetical protein